jgi:hypothetical protein
MHGTNIKKLSYIFAQFISEVFNSHSKDVKDGTNAKLALFDCKEVSKNMKSKHRVYMTQNLS